MPTITRERPKAGAKPTPIKGRPAELRYIDHLNVRCRPSDMKAIRVFYTTVLGLHEGPRPGFGFPGYWLYSGDRAVVHISATKPESAGLGDAQKAAIDHVSFRSTGLSAMRAHLKSLNVPFEERPSANYPLYQIFINDPVGAKIELTFDKAEFDREQGKA